jgi:hypothetical protein
MKLFAIAIAASLTALPVYAAALSPDDIARDIKVHGAHAVVARLAANGDYDRVMDKVDTGDKRWVMLAPLLAPGADAGAAEELPIALAFALPHNPQAVLSVVGGNNGFPVEDVCGAPFIEGTVDNIPAYIKRAETAVSHVSEPSLADVKARCLRELKKAAAAS